MNQQLRDQLAAVQKKAREVADRNHDGMINHHDLDAPPRARGGDRGGRGRARGADRRRLAAFAKAEAVKHTTGTLHVLNRYGIASLLRRSQVGEIRDGRGGSRR